MSFSNALEGTAGDANTFLKEKKGQIFPEGGTVGMRCQGDGGADAGAGAGGWPGERFVLEAAGIPWRDVELGGNHDNACFIARRAGIRWKEHVRAMQTMQGTTGDALPQGPLRPSGFWRDDSKKVPQGMERQRVKETESLATVGKRLAL
jgi:hypothetical protein